MRLFYEPGKVVIETQEILVGVSVSGDSNVVNRDEIIFQNIVQGMWQLTETRNG